MTEVTETAPLPRWRLVYDVLKTKKVGDTITYEEIFRSLGYEPSEDRDRVRHPLYRAGKEFLRFDKHDLETIPNVGYRVVDAEGHLRNASRQQMRANNALERGHERVVNVDLTGVEPEVRKALETIAVGFSRQLDFNRRVSDRQAAMEQTLQEVSVHADETDEELADLRERMRRMEEILQQTPPAS